ncbi:MAG TPA: DUF2007 domain-containing protein [Allosphingosinicella sp.]|jgi:hypothetical protein
MALVEIASFRDPVGGALARARLAAEGIDSVLFDAGLSSLGLAAMIPVRLMVEEEDRERAERLLAERP